jgi:hypothetical protein
MNVALSYRVHSMAWPPAQLQRTILAYLVALVKRHEVSSSPAAKKKLNTEHTETTEKSTVEYDGLFFFLTAAVESLTVAHVKESTAVGVGMPRSAENRRSPRRVAGSYPQIKSGGATRHRL